jgi:hypothetical protein
MGARGPGVVSPSAYGQTTSAMKMCVRSQPGRREGNSDGAEHDDDIAQRGMLPESNRPRTRLGPRLTSRLPACLLLARSVWGTSDLPEISISFPCELPLRGSPDPDPRSNRPTRADTRSNRLRSPGGN